MSDLLLPSGTHLIHIGPQKTGSTAIQNAMFAGAATLLEHQVYYASRGKARAREAGWAILGGRAPVGRPAPRMEEWWALVEEVKAAQAERVVVSNEDFGRATPEEIEQIVSGLGGNQPHMVAVVRRLDRYFPSQWQERVKARDKRSYEDWLRVILAEESDDWQWQHIWYPHRVGALVERWAEVIGRENITLIVADDKNRALLPNTFEDMLGLPRETLYLDELQGNRSLSFNEAELLRRINEHFLDRRFPNEAYAQYVQGGVIKGLKLRQKPASHVSGPGVPEWGVDRIRLLCDEHADEVIASAVRVIGDPEKLRAPADLGAGLADVSEVDLETAARAAVGIVEKALRLEEKAARRLTKAKRNPQRNSTGQQAGVDLSGVSARELAAELRRRAAGRLRG